ncbi:MAG: hypothetical protein IKG52_15895 [Rhodobacteraceae bacterium]|nr:hypothetical protein [Paracoccaceae bacterium]
MSGFSPVRLLGRISPGSKGVLFGPSAMPRPAPPALPPADHSAIVARLAPVLQGLNRDRTVHVDQIDRALKLYGGGAAVVALVVGWGIGGSFLGGLALMALAVVSVVILVMAKAEDGPRAETRRQIVAAVAGQMSDLIPDPAPDIPREWFAGLRLVQQVRKVIVDLRLTGERAGRVVGVTRVGLMFGEDRRYTEKHDKGLSVVMVQVSLPETAARTGVTVVTPTDASWNVRHGPKLSHGLKTVQTGDKTFDALYTVYGDPAPLTPALRAGFAGLERHARSAKHGLAEVAPGKGLRPWVVILPGQLVVLTPLAMFDGAFEPPAFWLPLDPDTLIPAFAADLAVLDGYLTAALSLPFGDIA